MTYATIVLIAVLTTMMTAPLLRWSVGRADQEAMAIEQDPLAAGPPNEISA